VNNFHQVRSAQQPTSNLEIKLISIGEKVVGVVLNDELLQRKRVKYEFCTCKMMKKGKSI
jgi:hypothetical protein